jgi:hypothetical protein
MKLCFAALHPAQMPDPNAESLAPYKRFVVMLLGRRIESMLLGSDRPAPVIFKSYLGVLEAALKAVIQSGFREMFEIAKTRNDVLGMHPVEWTKRQLDILISAEKSGIRFWIQRVCDALDSSTTASHDDSIFWGNWRAPRLIHMQPAGNAPYDQASVWTREDLFNSQELLEGRAEHTTVFLRLDLNELARAAHVEFAKRSVAKPQVSRTGEGVRQTAPVPKVPPIEGDLAPDLWRSFHDRFKALAEEEITLAPQNSGDRWLRAYVDYKDRTKTFGEWNLSESIHENFRERFEVEATRAGIVLGSDLTGEPLTLWLHNLFFDLLQHKSKLLFAATEEGGVIVRVCEASAIYCARLEKQTLIEGRKRPAAISTSLIHETTSTVPSALEEKVCSDPPELSKGVREGKTVDLLYGQIKRIRRLYRETGKSQSQIREMTSHELTVMWEWTDRISDPSRRSEFLKVSEWDDGDGFVFRQIATLYQYAPHLSKKPSWSSVRDWRKAFRGYNKHGTSDGRKPHS